MDLGAGVATSTTPRLTMEGVNSRDLLLITSNNKIPTIGIIIDLLHKISQSNRMQGNSPGVANFFA